MTSIKLVRSGVLVFLAGSVLSCTRNSGGGNARITMKMPDEIANKVSSSSAAVGGTLKMFHVAVQVSAPDMTEKIQIVFNREDSGTIPAELSLDIPNGDNRLVQVVAAYGTSDSDSKLLFYGDAVASLKGTLTKIDIPVGRIGTGTSDVDLQFNGRFFDSPTSGPSGELKVLYSPVGKPPILVTKDLILGGWFSTFIFEDIKLDYILPDGTALFTQMRASDLNPTEKAIKIKLPPYFQRNYETTTSSYLWEGRPASGTILGFFSKNPTTLNGKIICVKDKTLNNNGTLFASYLFSAMNNYTPLIVKHYPTAPGTYPSDEIAIVGGVATSSSPCMGLNPATEYIDYLRLEALEPSYDGGIGGISGFAGINGVMRATLDPVAPGSPELVRRYSKVVGSPLGLVSSSSTLPGVDAAIDGISFYTSSQSFNNDYTDCRPDRLQSEGWSFFTSRKRDFIIGGKVLIGPAAVSSLSLPSGKKWGYCLTSRGRPVGNLVQFKSNSAQTPTLVTLSARSPDLQTGICHPVVVSLAASGSNPVYNPYPAFSVTINSSLTDLYTSSDCSTTALSNHDLAFASYADSAVIYVKENTPGTSTSLSLTSPLSGGTAISGISISATLGLSFAALPTATKLSMSTSFSSSDIPFRAAYGKTCIPVRVLAKTNTEAPASLTPVVGVSYYRTDKTTTYTLPTGDGLVNSCNDTTPVSNFSFSSGSSVKELAFVTAGSTPVQNLIIKLYASGIDYQYFLINPTPLAHHLDFTAPGPFAADTCHSIDIGSFNETGASTSIAMGEKLEFFLRGPLDTPTFAIRFFNDDSSCSTNTGSLSNFSILELASTKTIYFKATGYGTANLSYDSQLTAMPMGTSLPPLIITPSTFQLGATLPGTMLQNTTNTYQIWGGKPPYYSTFDTSLGRLEGTISYDSTNPFYRTITVNTPGTAGIINFKLFDSSSPPLTINSGDITITDP